MHSAPTLERVLKTIALTHYQGQLCRAVNADALYGFSAQDTTFLGPYTILARQKEGRDSRQEEACHACIWPRTMRRHCANTFK